MPHKLGYQNIFLPTILDTYKNRQVKDSHAHLRGIHLNTPLTSGCLYAQQETPSSLFYPFHEYSPNNYLVSSYY